jgi:hypothetical protein
MHGIPIVIISIGNVGAGKTTYISLTFNELRRRGYKVHKTYVKTQFVVTSLMTKLRMPQIVWRIAVMLDLLLNVIYLPLAILIKTFLIPRIKKRDIVLVEEHLPGSLVDFVHLAILLNLACIVKCMLRALVTLSRKCLWHAIIYITVDKMLLPRRWLKRGSPPETKLYLLSQDLVFSIITRYSKNVLIIDNSNKDFHHNLSLITSFISMLYNKEVGRNI